MARAPKPKAPADAPVPAIPPASDAAEAIGSHAAGAVQSDVAPVAPATAPTGLPVVTSIEQLLGLTAAMRADTELLGAIAISVSGPATGRRRAGRSFGLAPVIVPIGELSDEELIAIDADPFLSWAVISIGAPEADDDED